MEEIPSTELAMSPSSSPGKTSVKSNAVVMYSQVEAPVLYAPLRHNTDIKLPPRNWLSSSAASRGLNDSRFGSSGFSSFSMAHKFPESVGEVDVVSDAENIKKLLKIPYSSNSVSMVVHRVENTLLIDEFDIHKHLLSRAEDEWAWLRQYFIEHILSTLSSKDKALPYHQKSRNALQQKSLVSKFLHYSLAETDDDPVGKTNESTKDGGHHAPLPLAAKGPALPDPQTGEGIPCSKSDHKFSRNVLWTFEDIQMLLGTDMPIFGGPSRPCISLRLRDAQRPISVLTGIDYWLDNLMSNVPEVVMCYHLDGIVQKYELIKTEDLPNLKESKFSPNLIRDVAQNILSFLKANATKAGHTYWLFKGTNEDAVKLYDLTSLCSERMRDKEQNPFTVPVGMLLYRVARNMMASGHTPGHNNTLRTVLKNCISLLSKEKYPQIVTSAHYMLADVYIPSETDPESPVLLSQSEHELSKMDDNEDTDNPATPVTTLMLNEAQPNKPPNSKYDQASLARCGVEERCKLALQHVLEGLDCLKYFDSSAEPKNECQEEPKMANPFEPIPMGFDKPKEKTRKKKKKVDSKDDKEVLGVDDLEDKSLKGLLCKPYGKTLPTWQRPEEFDDAAWKGHLLYLLASKACLVYSILVEKEIEDKKYQLALKHIKALLKCCGDNRALAGLMLSRAGDCWLHLADYLMKKCPNKVLEVSTEDEYPTVALPIPSSFDQELNLLDSVDSVDELFDSCISCYQRSLEVCPTEDTQRRMGNACNIISSVYTHQGTDLLQTEDCNTEEFDKVIAKSEELLTLGVKMFEAVYDLSNKALLLSNWGRLHRLRGHRGAECDPNVLKPHYLKAIDCYTRALQNLDKRKAIPGIWDLIYWELSTTLYTLATLTQDHPPLPTNNKSAEEIEREVVELLQKAIKYCDVNSNSHRQPLYQFRAALLHLRLASLYFNSYRVNNHDDHKVKQIVQLCDINYGKAVALFWTIDHPLQVVNVLFQRSSLYEILAQESRSTKLKIKHYQKALSILGECSTAVSQLAKMSPEGVTVDSTTVNSEQSTEVDEGKLLLGVQNRLNSVLLALIKLTSNSEKNAKLTSTYKDLYKMSLTKDGSVSLVCHLAQVLQHILS